VQRLFFEGDLHVHNSVCDCVQSLNILVEVYDNVLPCFPRSFDPLEVCVLEFSSHASYMLDALGQGAPMMDNGALLALLGWQDSYRTTCVGLGCSDEMMAISTRPCVKTPYGEDIPMHGLDVARLVYIDRIRSQLAKAFKNLAEIDLLKEPEPDGRGRLWTPGVIELFRFLSQQVQLAAGVRDPEVLHNVSGVALQVMQSCASITAFINFFSHQGKWKFSNDFVVDCVALRVPL
jgi:Exocyst complex component Sec6